MQMQLFTDTGFFIWLAGLSVPAIVLGLLGKQIKYYGMAVTLVFIWLAMGSSLMAVFYLIGFCAFEFVLIRKYLAIRRKRGKVTWIYRMALALAIAPLAVNKILQLTSNAHHILAFIGISYMTFKVCQIVIEIYDGLIEEVKAFDFFYLLLFFPTLSSGPIDRSRRFGEDLVRRIERSEYIEMLGEGLFRIATGLLYKIVLAALFYSVLNWFGTGHNLRSLIIYMYCYGAYLFFDFAGYSHMAVGAGYIFGIRVPENFRLPFISKDIKEFWDRWHISLSHWFRDYLFSRISLAFVKRKVFKSRLTTQSVAFMINMTVMGIWHGLTPSYILYGVYHGALLALTGIFQKKSRFYKKYKKNKAFIFVEWLVTMHLVLFGFLIFSGQFLKALSW